DVHKVDRFELEQAGAGEEIVAGRGDVEGGALQLVEDLRRRGERRLRDVQRGRGGDVRRRGRGAAEDVVGSRRGEERCADRVGGGQVRLVANLWRGQPVAPGVEEIRQRPALRGEILRLARRGGRHCADGNGVAGRRSAKERRPPLELRIR